MSARSRIRSTARGASESPAASTGSRMAPSRPGPWRDCCAPRASKPRAHSDMRELVEFLARALVEDPDSVQVEELEENGDLVLEITVGGDDLGRLIGKGGRVANAIRTVAKAASTRAERRVLVEFVED